MLKKRLLVLCFIVGSTPVLANADEPKPVLSGEWVTDCLPIGKNGRHGYVITISIVDDAFAANTQLYAKSSCQTPTVKVNYYGRLIGDKPDGDHIDFSHQVEKITYTLNSDDVTAFYNTHADGAGCGISSWKTNVAISVAGKTCEPISFAAEGVTLFERAWVDGNTLRFGNFPSLWTATDASLRPAMAASPVFHRTSN